ncbi:hypothetical protein RND81_13G136600 [Saponaria officinalis]|uniref:Uncharacterized protein n=1 Tax=Saponaria officinalis TaxID=3572 RepID=A0AAW1H3R5_SAPOF
MASLVIKVKYEDTLRRFNVPIKGDRRLDLSMESLRLKIRSLFNLPSNTEFRLTYEDEDDDVVTLVDDDDLHDVVTQGLDPVRITVHLNSDQSGRSSSASFSGNSAPSTPLTQNVQPNISSNAAEVLKAVQEPLNHVPLNLKSFTLNSQQNTDYAKIAKSVHESLAHGLSKLAVGISSKPASTSPIVVDRFDGRSKLEESFVNATLFNSAATSVSYQNNVGSDSKSNLDGKKHEGSRNDSFDKRILDAGVGVSVKSPLCPSVFPNKCKNPSSESSLNKMSGSGGMKKSKDVSSDRREDLTWTEFLRASGLVAERDFVRDAASKNSRIDYETIRHGECPFSGIPLTCDQSPKPMHSSNRSFNKANSLGNIVHKGIGCDGCWAVPITGPRFKSKVKNNYDLCSFCFSRMGNDRDYTRIDSPLAHNHPLSDKISPIFHEGIICDGCDAVPIIGPRENNYDLCSKCFLRMGNDLDYTRIDFSTRSCPIRLPNLKDLRQSKMRALVLEHRWRPDFLFVMDVTVKDGTVMAPSTTFIKIWLMRNISSLPWNCGLQLLWIGGDRLRSSDSINIQVPSNGVNVDSELDIAVDFVAPELPGKYISYWRMADLSGRKVGQRVWVQIQVDPSLDLTRESSRTLNLNLPPGSNETAFPEVVDVKAEAGESSAQSILDQNDEIQMLGPNFPINGDLLDAGNSAYPIADRPVSPVGPSASTCPKVDACSITTNVQDKSITLEKNNLDQVCLKTQTEEELLKELALIGFKQIDSEKEAFPVNELDLDVSEWDSILEELKEMGFEDKDTNKKLLAKNNGSISRVVKDLISEENA